MSSILAGLNPNQCEAVTAGDGPLLILAGAGSGKTRVLTHRIAWLIGERQVNPWNILAVTFTNKAAGEMKERVFRLVGEPARDIWIGTFHAICARILRQDGEKIGIPRDFVVYDDADQISLVKDCMAQLNLDEKQYQPRAVLSLISRAKEELVDVRNFQQTYSGHFEEIVFRVYRLYQQQLRASSALDFDDLIMATVRLLEESESAREFYRGKFRHILVDEYQDINFSQYSFIKLLAKEHRNLTVVGDDDQSIYAWRGADIRLILAFEKDYPEARVIKLEQNYRSTKKILDAAYHIVKNNRSRKDKRLWTENEDGQPIRLFEASDEHDEAVFVFNCINDAIRRRVRKLSDFAVLYRTNAQSRVLEDVLLNFGIPYKIVGGVRFYERREVKDIIAYLRLVQNPNDSVSLKRVINVPARGIGPTSWNRLVEFATGHGIPIMEAMQNVRSIAGITPKIGAAITEFALLIDGLRKDAAEMSVSQIVQAVIDRTRYLKALEQERSLEAQSRIENIKELLSVTAEFEGQSEDPSLAAFLEQVSLVSDVDSLDESADAVTLMTLHSAKGLEFPVVFMVGMEEGVFPHSRSLWEESELEEERRLAYVGVTRAREELYLTYALRRSLFGQVQRNSVSRFVREIPRRLFAEMPSARGSTSQTGLWSSMYSASDRPANQTISAVHQLIAGASKPTHARRDRAGMRGRAEVVGEGTRRS